ncbi:uncharacterized protein [Arachis hypogaea]|uniref:uncharacterized protein n=1 Tax=Arachis hypogaea TaxID=3818 RepID=UPI003B21D159
MVITTRIGTGLVKRILVDTGADSNIMFRNEFDALGLKEADLKVHHHEVIGLGDNYIRPNGVITLPVCVGSNKAKKSVMAEFVVLRDSTAYKVIMGRKTINEFSVVIYTKFLVIKFVTDDGTVGSIRGDVETTVACDNTSLFLRKRLKDVAGVFLADLDARLDENPRPEPQGDLEKFRVGDSEEKFTFVNRNLPHTLKEPLMKTIRVNDDLFTWTPTDMLGVDPNFMSHQLAIKPNSRLVAQRRRKMSQERASEVAKQTASLLDAGFIRELEYSTWLSNVVLVKKANGKWRMATYQRMMNKVFAGLIGKLVEVYVDAILVKTSEPTDLRGVESNLNKFEAVLRMKSSGYVKDVQRLVGRLTALSHFLGALATKAPLLQSDVKRNRLRMDPIIYGSSPSDCTHPKGRQDPITSIFRQKGTSRSRTEVHQARNDGLCSVDLIQKVETILPGRKKREGRSPIKIGKHKGRNGKLIPDPRTDKRAIGNPLYDASDAPPPSWVDPILHFLEKGQLPEDEQDAKTVRREATKYVAIQGQLYKRGLNQPLLKCLRSDQMDYVLGEVHEGCCGHHIGGKALVRKLVRARYYWPSMMSDAQEFVIRCKKLGPGKVKYLIVAIDYYTKWIEPEPLANISSANCQKFIWRQVVSRFGISKVVISDNGIQFADKEFGEFLSGLGVKQKFSSVEHPQSNGQVEAANKVILHGLKKRLDQKKQSWADELTSRNGPPDRKCAEEEVGFKIQRQSAEEELPVRGPVLRMNDIGLPSPGEGKLAANWEGPYRVREVLGKGAYKLECLDGSEVPRTWNVANLKRFYS